MASATVFVALIIVSGAGLQLCNTATRQTQLTAHQAAGINHL
jgi:hypothetical protein